FTVNDFDDLIRILEGQPEWRARLRALVLTDELLALPELVRQLVAAQERTEQRLGELAEAQRATEARLAELTTQGTGLGIAVSSWSWRHRRPSTTRTSSGQPAEPPCSRVLVSKRSLWSLGTYCRTASRRKLRPTGCGSSRTGGSSHRLTPRRRTRLRQPEGL